MKKTLTKVLASAAACAMLFSQITLSVGSADDKLMSIDDAQTRSETSVQDDTGNAEPFFDAATESSEEEMPDFSYLGAIGTLTAEQTQQVAASIYDVMMHYDELYAQQTQAANEAGTAPLRDAVLADLSGLTDKITLKMDTDPERPNKIAPDDPNMESVKRVYHTLLYSMREGMAFKPGYSVSYLSGVWTGEEYSDGTLLGIILSHPSGRSPDQDEIVNEKLDSIIALVDPAWSAPEKALFVHDYLAVHFGYDYDELERYNASMLDGSFVSADSFTCFTAYGMLLEDKAVCDGYSWLYNIILNECGVECYRVTSLENNHAWNMVRIDDRLYHVDVTWDDTSAGNLYGQVSHESFLKDSISMKSSGHSCELDDWMVSNGLPAYDEGFGATKYNNGFWNTNVAVYPFLNGWLVKEPDGNQVRFSLYTYDFESNEEEWVQQIATESDKWPVSLNTDRYWSDNYSVFCVDNDVLYYTTPYGVMAVVHKDGGDQFDYVWTWLFGLDNTEQEEGFIYGMYVDDSKIYYQVTLNRNSNTEVYEHYKYRKEYNQMIRSAASGEQEQTETTTSATTTMITTTTKESAMTETTTAASTTTAKSTITTSATAATKVTGSTTIAASTTTSGETTTTHQTAKTTTAAATTVKASDTTSAATTAAETTTASTPAPGTYVVCGKGDFNGDNEVTVTDFVALKRYLTEGVGRMNDEKRERIDIVGDGVIDVFDLAALQWQLVHQK